MRLVPLRDWPRRDQTASAVRSIRNFKIELTEALFGMTLKQFGLDHFYRDQTRGRLTVVVLSLEFRLNDFRFVQHLTYEK